MDDRHHDGDREKKNYKTNLLAAHLLKNSDSLTTPSLAASLTVS